VFFDGKRSELKDDCLIIAYLLANRVNGLRSTVRGCDGPSHATHVAEPAANGGWTALIRLRLGFMLAEGGWSRELVGFDSEGGWRKHGSG